MEKSNDKPLISVIIPAYNNAEELEKTLESVLSQTCRNLEIIVTDDGSETDLLPVITSANDRRIRYYRPPHANANAARNFGISKSRGEYIAMLDSGDCWQKEHLEECLDLLLPSGADGLYGSLICTSGIYEQTHPARELSPGETMADYLIATGYGAQTSTLFTTAGSMKDMLWDESLNRHQDYDFVIRYSKKYNWIAKTKATAIHPFVPKKEYDFDACIRFIKQYQSEISANSLIRYYRGMLLLAKNCDAPKNITNFYIDELNGLRPANLPQALPETVEISVIMPVYNAEKYITESIESILRQSFSDFELIVIDSGSTDDTRPLVHSFHDRRLIVIQSASNDSELLNTGMQRAKGKYIAFMNPGDIMHIDRLKIQQAILEEEPEIAVCGAWTASFDSHAPAGKISLCGTGLIERPLLQLLQPGFLTPSTVLLRKDFPERHHLQYENYPCAEHYKLWVEIAKRKGLFYIESQPLLFCRVSEMQEESSKQSEQEESSLRIRREIVEYLIEQNRNKYPELVDLYHTICALKAKDLFSHDEIFSFFHTFFTKNKLTME